MLICFEIRDSAWCGAARRKDDRATFHRRRFDCTNDSTSRSHIGYNRKWYDVIDRCLLPVRSYIHRSCRNGSQLAHPVRLGGLKTAREARTRVQPERTWSFQLSLSGHNLHCESLQHLPLWLAWPLAVLNITLWKPSLDRYSRFYHQPCGRHRWALSESCPCSLE